MEKKVEKEINKKIVKATKKIVAKEISNVKTIELYLNKDNIYDEFSANTKVNDDIYNYLIDSVNGFANNQDVHINIHLFDLDKDEEDRFINKLDDNLINKAALMKIDLRRSNFIGINLLIIGILALTLFFVLNYVFNTPYTEVVSILSWVFIWEGFDILFLQNSQKRRRIKKIKMLINAKKRFIEND